MDSEMSVAFLTVTSFSFGCLFFLKLKYMNVFLVKLFYEMFLSLPLATGEIECSQKRHQPQHHCCRHRHQSSLTCGTGAAACWQTPWLFHRQRGAHLSCGFHAIILQIPSCCMHCSSSYIRALLLDKTLKLANVLWKTHLLSRAFKVALRKRGLRLNRCLLIHTGGE